MQIREIKIVLLVFAAGVLVKMLVVLPNGFGLIKDVGETKYLYMLQYFNEGIFLHSATEFTTHYPPLYPLILAAAYSVRDHAYEVIKLINAILASSLVFPLYFLARRLFTPKISLIIIAIASLIPFQFEMPIRLLSENLYFPLLLFTLYLTFTQPEDSRYRFVWDSLTGFSMGLLYLTRYISLAIIPFFMLVWWLKPFDGQNTILRFSRRKLLHAVLVLFMAGITFLPWVNVGLENNLPLSQMLGFGIAANTNPSQLTAGNLLKWMSFYAAYYILLAAPVLNLLGIVLGSFSFKDLNKEENRWILTILILIAAFSLAIVRHSWRADYNLELPKRLMGRYVIYFVPLFILSAFLARSRFAKEKYRNLTAFLLRNEILPLILIGVSYLLVIRGSLIPVNSEFIHPLISIDGYYIKLLGVFFFIFLVLLFTGSNLLLWYGKRGFVWFMLAGLCVYYIAGQPAYLKLMRAEQSAQQLGKIALDQSLSANQQAGRVLSYQIFMPDELTRDELDDVAWTFFIRHPLSEWELGRYNAEKIETLETDAGIILLPLDQAQEELSGGFEVVTVNGQRYALELILAPN